MNRERWLLLISILLLGATAAYYLRPQWFASLTGKRAVTVASKPSSPAPAAQQGATAPALPPVTVQSESVDERAPWGRNPFLTGEEESGRAAIPASDGLQVKAIIVGRPNSVATIDGRTVMVGEKFGEETVMEIRPDGVVLERDGHRRMVKVSEPAISIQVKERKK